jgi:hypothetical protein
MNATNGLVKEAQVALKNIVASDAFVTRSNGTLFS